MRSIIWTVSSGSTLVLIRYQYHVSTWRSSDFELLVPLSPAALRRKFISASLGQDLQLGTTGEGRHVNWTLLTTAEPWEHAGMYAHSSQTGQLVVPAQVPHTGPPTVQNEPPLASPQELDQNLRQFSRILRSLQTFPGGWAVWRPDHWRTSPRPAILKMGTTIPVRHSRGTDPISTRHWRAPRSESHPALAPHQPDLWVVFRSSFCIPSPGQQFSNRTATIYFKKTLNCNDYKEKDHLITQNNKKADFWVSFPTGPFGTVGRVGRRPTAPVSHQLSYYSDLWVLNSSGWRRSELFTVLFTDEAASSACGRSLRSNVTVNYLSNINNIINTDQWGGQRSQLSGRTAESQRTGSPLMSTEFSPCCYFGGQNIIFNF